MSIFTLLSNICIKRLALLHCLVRREGDGADNEVSLTLTPSLLLSLLSLQIRSSHSGVLGKQRIVWYTKVYSVHTFTTLRSANIEILLSWNLK